MKLAALDTLGAVLATGSFTAAAGNLAGRTSLVRSTVLRLLVSLQHKGRRRYPRDRVEGLDRVLNRVGADSASWAAVDALKEQRELASDFNPKASAGLVLDAPE